MTITWISQCMERTKKALECKQRHPRTMNHQRGGDLYFKSGKDTCISIIMHCFYHCQISDTYHFSGSVFSNPTSFRVRLWATILLGSAFSNPTLFWVRLWAPISWVVCFLILPHFECVFEPSPFIFWVGHPLQRDQCSMFFLSGYVTHYNETIPSPG